MTTTEKTSDELKAGDVLVSRGNSGERYTVKKVEERGGCNGYSHYLYLTDKDGKEIGHDCSFDSVSAKFLVETE